VEKTPKKRRKSRVVGGTGKGFGSRFMGDVIVESEKRLRKLIQSKRQSVEGFLHPFFFGFQ